MNMCISTLIFMYTLGQCLACVRFVYVILMRSEGGVGDSGPEIQCMYAMQPAGLMQFGPRCA